MVKNIDFLCLANSYKEGGRCVAGLDIDTGEWIRPVSNEEKGELHRHHYLTVDGNDPDTLDTMNIYLDHASPIDYQPENWEIMNESWKLLDEGLNSRNRTVLNEAFHDNSKLFGDTNNSIEYNKIKRQPIDSSLELIQPNHPQVYLKNRNDRKDQVRVIFEIDDVEYDLPITDPEWIDRIRSEKTGIEELKYEPISIYLDENTDPALTVSLGTPYNGRCYKLVAAIIPIPSNL